MTGSSDPAPNCAGCAFWRKLRENEGVCCRHAPEPSNRPEEVAHWPQTHSRQWCGEGAAAALRSIGSRCADSVFWRHPGLNPVNQGDMPMAWWRTPESALASRPGQFQTRSTRFLAGGAGDGFLRRWRGAETRRDTAAPVRNGKSILLFRV
jgi:hypothetical protein